MKKKEKQTTETQRHGEKNIFISGEKPSRYYGVTFWASPIFNPIFDNIKDISLYQ